MTSSSTGDENLRLCLSMSAANFKKLQISKRQEVFTYSWGNKRKLLEIFSRWIVKASINPSMSRVVSYLVTSKFQRSTETSKEQESSKKFPNRIICLKSKKVLASANLLIIFRSPYLSASKESVIIEGSDHRRTLLTYLNKTMESAHINHKHCLGPNHSRKALVRKNRTLLDSKKCWDVTRTPNCLTLTASEEICHQLSNLAVGWITWWPSLPVRNRCALKMRLQWNVQFKIIKTVANNNTSQAWMPSNTNITTWGIALITLSVKVRTNHLPPTGQHISLQQERWWNANTTSWASRL